MVYMWVWSWILLVTYIFSCLILSDSYLRKHVEKVANFIYMAAPICILFGTSCIVTLETIPICLILWIPWKMGWVKLVIHVNSICMRLVINAVGDKRDFHENDEHRSLEAVSVLRLLVFILESPRGNRDIFF